MNTLITCHQAGEIFGKAQDPICHDGSVTVKFIYKDADINTGKREYQREKVAPVEWKQAILVTVISKTFCKIPEIHIRVVTIDVHHIYELVDGQQRVTSITDYLEDEFPLPDNFVVDGVDLSGLYASELKEKHMAYYQMILNYNISCKWYENLTDEQTA